MATPAHLNARGAYTTRPITDVSVIAPRPGPSIQRTHHDGAAPRRLAAGALLLVAVPVTALAGAPGRTTTVAGAMTAWVDLLSDAVTVGPTFALVRDALDMSNLTAVGAAGDVASVWAALLLLIGGVLAAGTSKRVLAGALAMAGTTLATIAVPLRAVARLGDRPDVFVDVVGAALATTGVIFLPVVAVGLAVGTSRGTPSVR